MAHNTPTFQLFDCTTDWKAIDKEAALAISSINDPISEEPAYNSRSLLEMSFNSLKKLLKHNNETKNHP